MKEDIKSCRICFDEEGILIHPCKCKGTIGYVHRECLNKWREYSNSPSSCDNCKTEFIINKFEMSMFQKIILFLISFTLFSFIMYIFYLINENAFYYLSQIFKFFEYTPLFRGHEYYKAIKQEVFELEKSLFSKKLFELFHNLTRASFILWFIECVRELIMTHLRRQRFTIREKLNTIIRVCLCVTTFPSFRPYFLGKQKYWVFFGKVLLLFHSIFQYYYFHKGMEYYFTVYILEKDTEFIENLEKKDN